MLGKFPVGTHKNRALFSNFGGKLRILFRFQTFR